jgi:hypothetical protein
MTIVYTDYFQKSKVFLYPLLHIKKGMAHVPIQTYVAWDNVYDLDDYRFFCEYKTKKTPTFIKFEKDFLLNHSLFEDSIELDEKRHLYIFDFTKLKSDHKRFVKGKYSQLTLETKISIIEFFGSKGKISEYVQGFLSPEEVHEEYALFLGVDKEIIESTYEVCTPPDIEKETLFDNNQIIKQLLKRSSISLTK